MTSAVSIVDTDINGVNDDAFALHYLLAKQYIPAMITTCSGNTLACDSLDDARILLASYGIEMTTQAGPDSPQGWTPEIHEYHRNLRKESDDSVYLGELGSPRTHSASTDDGRTIAYAATAPLAGYLALGPLGNLRDALVSAALPATGLQHLVFSGGAFGVPGNVGRLAEFNILADPLAAAYVFAAPLARVTVVPLDVTAELTYGLPQYRRITSGTGPFSQDLGRTKGAAFAAHPDFREPLWDLIAAMVMTNPEIITRSVRGEVSVGTSPTASLGATTLRRSDHGHVTVVLEVDTDGVLDEWTRTFESVQE
ncbi:MAG: nucleoside hydrolase [Streptosporangiaceae bacterium]|jgi:purine nucleosidase